MEAYRILGVAKLDAAAASSRVAVPLAARWVLITCTGDVHVAWGDSSVTASSASFPLPGGFTELIELPFGTTHIAVVKTIGSSDSHVGIAAVN